MGAQRRPAADQTSRPQPRWLVCLAFVVWCLGALLSHRLGIWLGIGSAAVALGGWSLSHPRVRQRLRPTAQAVAVGLAAGLAMVGATQVLFPLVLRCVPAVGPQTAALYAAFGRATPLKLAMMLLVIVGEEGVWRGAVQQRLAGYLGRWPAVAVTAVLYAIAHLPVGSPLLAVVALCCGLYWSHLAAWTGSLLCPLLTHAIWDVAVLVVWPLLRI